MTITMPDVTHSNDSFEDKFIKLLLFLHGVDGPRVDDAVSEFGYTRILPVTATIEGRPYSKVVVTRYIKRNPLGFAWGLIFSAGEINPAASFFIDRTGSVYRNLDATDPAGTRNLALELQAITIQER